MNIHDTKTIKKDFPYFNDTAGSAYLDNAATAQMPQMVLDTVRVYEESRANVHRGLYAEAITADTMYEEAREKVAQFIGAKPGEVIFTAGATASSNMLVSMLEHSGIFEAGEEIVTTVMEHHASLIPLQELAKRQSLLVKYISVQGLSLDYREAEQLITPKTKIVSVVLASNVTGVVNDVSRIVEIAHKVGALVICDATAAVGHMPVMVKTLGVDFVYFSGHKMCGPTGIGVLWGKQEILETLEPGVYGGGIVDEVTLEKAVWRGAPERFEAGTPNIAGAIGLGAAVEYLATIDPARIHAHTSTLVAKAIAEIEKIPGVRVLAEHDPKKNIGIVSFVIEGASPAKDRDGSQRGSVFNGVHPHDVAEVLGGVGVAVRAGHHCAMPLHAALGVPATVRASFYLYNTEEDIEALVAGVKKVKEVFNV